MVKIVNYDGCMGKYGVYFPSDGEVVYICTGKYGVYFPSDGEVVCIYPDDEDVVFLTWLANILLLGSEYLKEFVYVAISYINLCP